MELELPHADRPGPLHGFPEQGRTDSAPAMAGGDHQAEVGDVLARRVRVAAERKPADDARARALGDLGDENRGVVVAPKRAQVPPLLARCPPGAVRDQPAFRLRGDGLAELHERPGIPGLRTPDDDALSRRRRFHGLPSAGRPPRHACRPGAAQRPRRRRSTGSAASSGPRRSRGGRARRPRRHRSRPRSGHVRPPGGPGARSIASSTGSPWPTVLTTIWRMAPRSLAEPALPTTRRGRPSWRTSDGAIMLVRRPPGRRRRRARFKWCSPSMLFRWMPVPGTITPEPGSGRCSQ